MVSGASRPRALKAGSKWCGDMSGMVPLPKSRAQRQTKGVTAPAVGAVGAAAPSPQVPVEARPGLAAGPWPGHGSPTARGVPASRACASRTVPMAPSFSHSTVCRCLFARPAVIARLRGDLGLLGDLRQQAGLTDVWVSGFSQYTCLPARIAARPTKAWRWSGVGDQDGVDRLLSLSSISRKSS